MVKPIMFTGVPPCTDAQTFDMWRVEARTKPPGPLGFCEDCTKPHQSEMRRQGRCEHPEVTAGEDFADRHEKQIETWARKPKKSTAYRDVFAWAQGIAA